MGRNSVSGSSTRKAKVNLSNTYGIKAGGTGVNFNDSNTKTAVTMGKPSNKNSAKALKAKVRG